MRLIKTIEPPHNGQVQSEAGWIRGSEWWCRDCGVVGAPAGSNRLQIGTSAPRRRLARKPKCRIRTKPPGSTCSKNRRKNSSTGKLRSRCLFLCAESRQRNVTLSSTQETRRRLEIADRKSVV